MGGGSGGVSGVGLGAGRGLGGGVGGVVGASSVSAVSANAPVGGTQSSGAGQPAVKLALSPEALSMLTRPGAVGGASSLALIGVGAGQGVSSLANTLVEAAVLAALLDNTKDDNKDKAGNVAPALVMAAAMRAYQQVAALPGVNIASAVPGSGVTISISSGAAA